MSSRGGAARIATVAISAAGVVGAHALAYRWAYADDAVRAHVLEASGHGYWDLAVLMGVAGFVLAVGVEMAFGRRRAEPPLSVLSAWGRLVALQASTFAVLELSERAVRAQELTLLLHEPAVLPALPLLAITAALGCAVLMLARRAGAIIARLRGAPREARRVVLRIEAHDVPVISHPGLSYAHERAPPPSLAA
ncbi:MAG: hypothetical protein ACRDK3_08695 [Actinomycetota bacterium]